MLLSLVNLRTLIPVVGVVTFLASSVLASSSPGLMEVETTSSDVDMTDTASLTAQPGGLPNELITMLGDRLLSSHSYADLFNLALINRPTWVLMQPQLIALDNMAKATGIAIARELESITDYQPMFDNIAALLDKFYGTSHDANVKVHVPLSSEEANIGIHVLLMSSVEEHEDSGGERGFFPLLKHFHFDALELFNGVICPIAEMAVSGSSKGNGDVRILSLMKDSWMAAAEQIPRKQYPCEVYGTLKWIAALNAKLKKRVSYLSDYLVFVQDEKSARKYGQQ